MSNPKEKWVIVPGAHEAIVPLELFNEVQEILSKKRRSNFDQRTLIVANSPQHTWPLDSDSGDIGV